MFFLSWLYWNPKKEIFIIPYLHLPVLWYSVLFALGFFIGYYIFLSFLKRYLLNFPLFSEKDVLDWDLLISNLKNCKTKDQKLVASHLSDMKLEKFDLKKKKKFLNELNSLFSKELVLSEEKIKGVLDQKKAQIRLFLEKIFPGVFLTIKEKASYIAERITLYMVIATVVGARLGHLIFYEDFSYYLQHPLKILKTWDGGLASHGAAVAIILGLYIFSKRIKQFYPTLSLITLLDLVSLPTCFAAVCIRIGNFFNQEILGKNTDKFWGVIFGSPIDGVMVPRHPAQLYEAFFYLLLFFLLLALSFKPRFYLKQGRFIGLFLFFVFTFRFFIEFLKVEQSSWNQSYLLMGQFLSIPFIILGLIFIFRKKKIFP